MIPWWTALIALVVGEIIGVVVLRFLTMNEKPSKYIKWTQ